MTARGGTAVTQKPATYRGVHWNDHELGRVYWSTARTVTETDVLGFAAVSGDFNPLHTDNELGRASVFGEKVPHGPLGMLFAMGGYDRIGLVEGVAIAFLEIGWRFKAPMRIGDTVRAKVTIAKLTPTKHENRGIVTLGIEMLNQRDEVVQEGEHTFLIRRHSEEGA
jgi:acyl dehydratase